MTATITFRPTEEQGGFIEDLISTGDYSNQSEVIRAGLRLLQEQQAALKLTQLRQLLREGEHSPIVEAWSAQGFVSRMKEKHSAK